MEDPGSARRLSVALLAAPALLAEFVKLVSVVAGTRDCATGIRQLQQAVGPQAALALRHARVTSVHVSGSTATATLVAGSEGAVAMLAEDGGHWRLVTAPGIARR